ncbi:hypothetical protein SDC9_109350 [bioreactor metagenome]|uniref:Uncharacterized protein n=1 Tax=bioreactor metagenome TaxID=1076179 RepID=A0A645BBN1_9ZZZZ
MREAAGEELHARLDLLGLHGLESLAFVVIAGAHGLAGLQAFHVVGEQRCVAAPRLDHQAQGWRDALRAVARDGLLHLLQTRTQREQQALIEHLERVGHDDGLQLVFDVVLQGLRRVREHGRDRVVDVLAVAGVGAVGRGFLEAHVVVGQLHAVRDRAGGEVADDAGVQRRAARLGVHVVDEALRRAIKARHDAARAEHQALAFALGATDGGVGLPLVVQVHLGAHHGTVVAVDAVRSAEQVDVAGRWVQQLAHAAHEVEHAGAAVVDGLAAAVGIKPEAGAVALPVERKRAESTAFFFVLSASFPLAIGTVHAQA